MIRYTQIDTHTLAAMVAGVLASSLAAMPVRRGGPGRIEVDANDNPLRTDLAPLDLMVRDGRIAVPTGPGLGIEPDADALKRMATLQKRINA